MFALIASKRIFFAFSLAASTIFAASLLDFTFDS